MFSDPKPKKPDVKVVEEVENNVTVESNVTAPVEHIEKVSTVEKKYKLKPEPFSLESKEQDPELLGPQTTIDRGLDSVDKPDTESKESKKTSKVVAKDKFEKAKNENLPSNENKKEAL